jgi:hypothetical protein
MALQLRLEYEGAVYHGWREVSGGSPFTRKVGIGSSLGGRTNGRSVGVPVAIEFPCPSRIDVAEAFETTLGKCCNLPPPIT